MFIILFFGFTDDLCFDYYLVYWGDLAGQAYNYQKCVIELLQLRYDLYVQKELKDDLQSSLQEDEQKIEDCKRKIEELKTQIGNKEEEGENMKLKLKERMRKLSLPKCKGTGAVQFRTITRPCHLILIKYGVMWFKWDITFAMGSQNVGSDLETTFNSEFMKARLERDLEFNGTDLFRAFYWGGQEGKETYIAVEKVPEDQWATYGFGGRKLAAGGGSSASVLDYVDTAIVDPSPPPATSDTVIVDPSPPPADKAMTKNKGKKGKKKKKGQKTASFFLKRKLLFPLASKATEAAQKTKGKKKKGRHVVDDDAPHSPAGTSVAVPKKKEGKKKKKEGQKDA